VCSGRKAAVLGTPRRVSRTPPGSESGACFHRGDSGTWESQWSPWEISGIGVPTIEVKTPGVARRRPPRTRALRKQGTQNQRRDPRERGRRGSTERPRDGLLAVCADPRPEEGGEPRPTGPTGGKATPGIPFCWKESREGRRAYQPCSHNASRVRWVAQVGAKRGVTCWVSQGRKPLAPEEPDEGNLHVRSCGEGAG